MADDESSVGKACFKYDGALWAALSRSEHAGEQKLFDGRHSTSEVLCVGLSW